MHDSVYIDDPHPERLHRRYRWELLLYVAFAAFIVLLFLVVR